MAPATLTPEQQAVNDQLNKTVQDTINDILRRAEEKPAPEKPFDLAAALKEAPAGTTIKNGDWAFTKPAADTEPEKKSKSHKAKLAESEDDEDSEPDAADDPWAKAEAKLLSAVEKPLDGIELPGKIGFGSIAVGGIVGFGGSEVINGLVSPTKADGTLNMNNTVSQAAYAVALAVFGPKLMSKQATVVSVAIPASRVIADLLPLDRWVQWIVARLNRNGSTTTAQDQSALQRALDQVNARQRGATMGSTTVFDGIRGYNS